MKAFKMFLAGGVAIAALTSAAPAAAQYYPGGGYGYGGGGLDAIIGALLGQGQYGYGHNREAERRLVEQCIRVTTTELERRYGYNRAGGYGGYGGYGDQGGYAGYGGYGGYPNNQGYGGYGNYGQQSAARILGITNIQRRSNGGLRIRGTASSGQLAAYNQGYGGYNQGYGGYGQAYGGYNDPAADLRFNCSVDYRGRVIDVRFDRNNLGYGY